MGQPVKTEREPRWPQSAMLKRQVELCLENGVPEFLNEHMSQASSSLEPIC